MFAELSPNRKAALFTVVVLALAVVVALLITALEIPEGPAFMLWTATPVLATLLMMLVITRDGRSKDGWRLLGLHRLGARWWGVAFILSLLVSVVATVLVVLLGFASFVAPDNPFDLILNFLLSAALVTVTYGVAEEVAFRGYLLPQLTPLGRNRALLITGLVHAVWHFPLIFLTSLYHSEGDRLIVLPLFVATIVAAGFVFGDLRLVTGSVWPASIAHAVHNVAWATLATLTVTSSPVLVNEYLAGDNGIFILLGTVAAAFLLRWMVRRHPDPGLSSPLPVGKAAEKDPEQAAGSAP